MKKMTLTQFFQVNKPVYTHLKLTPDTSIRNYNSTNIAKSIANMYKTIDKRIKYEERHFVIETPVKCSFLIDIRKNSVDFYFIVPVQYKSIAKEKIRETWPRVTIEEVDKVEEYTKEALYYQLCYKKEDALSLNVDKTSNDPLNSILGVIDIMQDKDRLGIFYNFMPCSQFPWKKEYAETVQKNKAKMPMEREKMTASYTLRMGVTYLINAIDSIIEVIADFFGASKNKHNEQLSLLEVAAEILSNNIKLSSATLKKKESLVLNAQMLVISDSEDMTRKSNNALSVCQAYRAIEEDNELIYKKLNLRKEWRITDFCISGVEENKVSVDECQNFIQLPGRELLMEHKIINQVDTLETQVPEELRKGVMSIGTNTCKGNNQKAYLSTDKEYQTLTLCLVGPTRAGKTTLIQNLAKDAVDNNECTFLFDFCGNCELSDEVAAAFNKDKVLVIDCSDDKMMQGLGYNEAKINTENIFKQYENIKSQTSQVLTLINSINAEDKDLSGRMDKYLEAASLVVFISGGSIKDIFDVLRDPNKRHTYINIVPKQHKENLEEYVASLCELDEWSKETKDKPAEIIGNRMSYVNGIFDRVNKLKRNTYMELMLKHDCSNNINLIDEVQKPQLICLKMPEEMFKTETEKDIFCTYWLTKIWLALQIRKSMYKTKEEFHAKATKVNIFLDELYQVPQTQEFLRSKLSQIAKFKGKPIISCHHLRQISGIRQELKSASTSYMLISGCNKDNYTELKDELAPYELEDLLNLKRYHSLNLIKYEGGYAKFITKLPLPIK
jgi:hypothetical protein